MSWTQVLDWPTDQLFDIIILETIFAASVQKYIMSESYSWLD